MPRVGELSDLRQSRRPLGQKFPDNLSGLAVENRLLLPVAQIGQPTRVEPEQMQKRGV